MSDTTTQRAAPDILFNRSIPELGRLLRSGGISAIELAETALDRLERIGRSLNAVVTLLPERAKRHAAQADDELAAGIDRGPLHGIPWGAKDLLAVAGVPTTWGAPPLHDQRFETDAEVVRRLDEAGAVLVAKLATVEIAGGMGYEQPNAALTGPGRNAWDPERWAGGSSSGAGASVGARLVPFAIGSETWGSIHCPSSFNGVTGLRPTLGRVPRDGAMALSYSLDKIGPITTSAADCGLVLSAIADGGERSPEREERSTGFRFGVLRAAIDGADPTVAANAERALNVLRQMGTVDEIELPDYPWNEATQLILWAEEASIFEEFLDAGLSLQLAAPEDRTGMLQGLTLPAIDYLRATRLREKARPEVMALLNRFDLLVAPAYPVVAPPIDGPFREHFSKHPAEGLSAMGNLLGLPSICLPTGLGTDNLPTSIELLGGPWREGTILAAAIAYQARTDWHREPPPTAVGESVSR